MYTVPYGSGTVTYVRMRLCRMILLMSAKRLLQLVIMQKTQDQKVPTVRETPPYRTKILQVDPQKIGRFIFHDPDRKFLGDWEIEISKSTSDAQSLITAASQLRTSNVPVAFPTETVYGLGADATRSSAVLGVYKAKQRPSDNPLIVHICSLTQLRKILLPKLDDTHSTSINASYDLIPSVYHSVISRFWPGPLTIILPLPSPSPLASSVTASLSTFGARMPSSLLALALIHLAGVPIAAPSANTSTKPSTTTAAHVFEDLSGRIEYIIDGGPSKVGIESTVIDGLIHPPLILRPGSVSISQIKQCAGWEDVRIGYVDETQDVVPRAPGMKYRHYSPKAKVVLVKGVLQKHVITTNLKRGSIGVLRTKYWKNEDLEQKLHDENLSSPNKQADIKTSVDRNGAQPTTETSEISLDLTATILQAKHFRIHLGKNVHEDIWSIGLGQSTQGIAQRLFAALREFDSIGVHVIFVEVVDDNEADESAAIMNRLRKAAELELVS